jgi:hypothetical protein
MPDPDYVLRPRRDFGANNAAGSDAEQQEVQEDFPAAYEVRFYGSGCRLRSGLPA